MKFSGKRPTIVITTDVNGTTTPHNTFGELVRADGLYSKMDKLMKSYTCGSCNFSDVLKQMEHLTSGVNRSRLESYAQKMPLYTGVSTTFNDLIQSESVDAKIALSTTGFAGLMALVNKFRHRSLISVAASPVLIHLLREEEKSCLIRPIIKEKDKIQVIDDLVDLYRPRRHLLFHIGDTMGDFLAIRHAAELGGIGVAFNPNEPLKASIANLSSGLRKRIPQVCFIAGHQPDYNKVGDIIRDLVWKTLKTQL